MKKQYALIGLLTIVLGSTINVSAAQTTTNFSNNKNKEQISINLSSEEQKLITQEQKSVVNEIKKLDKEIDYAVSEHEKEFFIFKKAQCVRYWSELELNKKNIKKENFENVENIEKIEKERI